jgi:hypothetical protein
VTKPQPKNSAVTAAKALVALFRLVIIPPLYRRERQQCVRRPQCRRLYS